MKKVFLTTVLSLVFSLSFAQKKNQYIPTKENPTDKIIEYRIVNDILLLGKPNFTIDSGEEGGVKYLMEIEGARSGKKVNQAGRMLALMALEGWDLIAVDSPEDPTGTIRAQYYFKRVLKKEG